MIPRPARLDEAEALVHLAVETPGAPHWPVAIYRDLAVNPLRLLLILTPDDGAPIGYAAAALITPPPAEAELEALAVHPSAQRRGYGRLLLRAVQQWVLACSAEPLLLEVRASNLGAQRLYHAHGFLLAGRRRNYYKSPEEDAVLMKWTPGTIDSDGERRHQTASGIM